MPKKFTHTEAFASFGTVPRNVRWSWSARNEATKIVVGTLWQDQFKKIGGRLTYSGDPIDPSTEPQRRLAFDEWIENLAWAEEHCDGRFHVIVAIARDTSAVPRSIKECNPSKLVMKLKHLDRKTGEFTAEVE